ncbi:hypothetical protein ACFL3S_11315 [Gemmatimonadota bacterium]
MSKPEGRKQQTAEAEALTRLERAVRGAVASISDLDARLTESQKKGEEMAELLRQFTGGEEEPALILSRLGALEEENRALRDRLRQGLEGVDRLLARIRFLEEQT